MKKILMVITSHDQLGNTGHKTGFWLEEFTSPYYVFKDAGLDITLASPKGGQPPLDLKSNEVESQTESTHRFAKDEDAQQLLAHTVVLAEINAEDYDAVFYPGGHGPLWDLANEAKSITLLEEFDRASKPLGLVCHVPATLKNVKTADGQFFIKGKKITGFSNSEEDAVQLSGVVPFLIEDEFKIQGANYQKGAGWLPFVVTDGHLVTGQNPASSEKTAQQLLTLLGIH